MTRVPLLVLLLVSCNGAGADGDGSPSSHDSDSSVAGVDGGQSALDVYQSGSRIRMRVGTTADGAKEFRGWHDLDLGVDCWFNLAGDGVTRCLPSQVAWMGAYYADAGCTVPIAYGAPCGTAPAYASGSSLCGSHIYPVSGVFTGATVYSGSPASCYGSAPVSTYTYYSIGAEVAPATFQAMTESVE